MINHGPISFPDWQQTLARAGLEPPKLRTFEREIIAFLRHCKARHSPVTAELARQSLVLCEKQTTGPGREALRWFYREGRRGMVPSAATGGGTGAPAEANEAPRRLDSAIRDEGIPAPIHRPAPRPMEPPPAASDLVREPWERALNGASWERHFLWRTEQTRGHASVETAQIYLHVMKKPGRGVRSPFDGLQPSPAPRPTARWARRTRAEEPPL